MNQSATFSISNTALRKLGKKLRTQDFESECLVMLDNYRRSFKDCGNEVYMRLIEISKQVYSNPITTYRVKRINSIITKLIRLPTRQLDQIWDIAGCRCVVRNIDQVYKIRELIAKEYVIRNEFDHYKTLNESGYKSLHLYVESKIDARKKIEIQLRTETDHSWATLVEIVDLIYDVSIKEGKVDGKTKVQRDLEKFLLLVEAKESEYRQKVRALDIIIRYDIFNKLRNVFIRNYYDVRRQYAMLDKVKNSFFIIETDEVNYKPIITRFDDMKAAEDAYFQKYTNQENNNFVLINIANPSLENLEKAYSNYILTRHRFIEYYFNILGEVLLESVGFNLRQFRKTYLLYLETLIGLGDDFAAEGEIIDSTVGHNYHPNKVKYWRKEFVKRFGKRKSKVQEISKKLNLKLRELESDNTKRRYTQCIKKLEKRKGFN